MATPPDFVSGAVLTSAQMNSIGLWLVNTTSFTAAATVSLNNCFSADFSNYAIVLNAVHTTTGSVFELRFRVGGSDNTTSNYNYVVRRVSSAGVAFDLRDEARTTNTIQFSSATIKLDSVLFINNPFATANTSGTANGADANNANGNIASFAFNATTSFDGFTIFLTAGAITGTLEVYGYRE